jgi:predicted GNAT family acetyltransferase
MTIAYEPERKRFNMPTDAGDAYVTIRWDNDVMILPHAEVPSALRGTGAGGTAGHGCV